MKVSLIVMELFFMGGCATNSTAPTPPTYFAFPRKFKEVSVSYRNIPEHWEIWNDTWQFDPIRDTTTGQSSDDSGTSLFSGAQSFSFSPSSFSEAGDTVESGSFSVAIDSVNGEIERVYYFYGGPFDDVGWWGYSLDLRQIPYKKDSLNRIVATATGTLLNKALISFDTSSQQQLHLELSGFSNGNQRTYKGPLTDSSSMEIVFTP